MDKTAFDKKIESLKLLLPSAPKPAGSYHPVIVSGNTAYLSGQVSRTAEGVVLTGKLGQDLSLAEGQKAAQAAALNVVSVIRNLIGWQRFSRLLRVTGFVQTAPDFYEISQVMNGASDLFLEILGEYGVHARSAVGMASLPLNATVELEVTVELR